MVILSMSMTNLVIKKLKLGQKIDTHKRNQI